MIGGDVRLNSNFGFSQLLLGAAAMLSQIEILIIIITEIFRVV